LHDILLGKNILKNDIGSYIQKNFANKLEDLDCVNILRNIWIPDSTYTFPTKMFGKKARKFYLSWLQRWNWLSYSDLDLVFCKYCVLFYKKEGTGKGMYSPPKSFVSEPLLIGRMLLNILKCMKIMSNINFL